MSRHIFNCLALAAVFLCAQNIWGQPDAAHPEIRGVVLEYGVNQPIPGAEITITINQTQAGKVIEGNTPSPLGLGARRIGPPTVPPTAEDRAEMMARLKEQMARMQEQLERGPTVAGKVITDAQGAFRFQAPKFGGYTISAKKDGYERSYGGSSERIPPNSTSSVTLSVDHPSREEQLFLVRPAELSGRVIDADSRQPLPNFPIQIRRYTYRLGRGVSYEQHTVVTDSEGRLKTVIKKPALYIAIVEPRNTGAVQFLKEFSEEDTNAVDQDYQTSHWPGGAGLDTAYGVRVPSGGIVDLGTIRACKVTTYRVHVRVPAGGCNAGDKVQVEMLRAQGMAGFAGRLGETTCGMDFQIRNLEPGSYSLKVSADKDRLKDILALEVKDRNLDVTASLRSGADLEGQVILAEGARPLPLDRLEVTIDSVGSFVEYSHDKADAEGQFQFANISFGPRRLDLSGLGGAHYVKEVRYNGVPVFDNIFAASGVGSLQVVLDDKPAMVTGAVSDGDGPVREPYVVISKWPNHSGVFRETPKDTTGGNDGKFQFAGLAPGEYRILAVARRDADKLDEPGILDRLLANAEKVSLEPRGSQSLSLKIIDPMR